EKDLFNDKHLKCAFELATDPTNGLVDREELLKILEGLDANRHWVDRIDEITVVIHSLEDSNVELSIIVSADEETLNGISSLVPIVNSLLRVNSRPSEENDDSISPTGFQSKKNVINGSVVITNSSLFLDRITSNNKNSLKRSFADSRRFRRVKSQLDTNPLKNRILTAMGNPDMLRPFFSKFDDQQWNGMLIHELPSFGVQAAFGDGNKGPNFLFEAYCTMTLPRTGLGKLIEAYEPIEFIPAGAQKVQSMQIGQFDPFRIDSANRQIFERQSPDRNYKSAKENKYKNDKRDYFEDVVPRTNYTVILYTKSDAGKVSVIMCERVADCEAMERYVSGLVQTVNAFRRGRSKIESTDLADLGRLYAIGASSENPGLDETIHEGFHEQSYLLTDNWYVTGRPVGLLREQMSLLLNGHENENITGSIDDLSRKIRLISNPFKVDYYTADYLLLRAGAVEGNRIVAKHGGRDWDQVESALNRPPNEFGYQMKIESQEDTRAIVEKQLRIVFANFFGNQLFHYSQTDNGVQLVGGFFPSSKEKDD
ncbi:MAG: hypothetical protein AAF939_22640, partial [Planctomycetota bacterium]